MQAPSFGSLESRTAQDDNQFMGLPPSTNENEVVLALNYRSTGNVTAKVLRSHISNGKNPDLNNSAILYDANSNFAEGEDNFILERIDIAKDLSISLTLEESTNAKTSCTASAPAYVVVPPAPTESEFKQKQEAILAKLRDVQVNTSNQACGGLMNMITDLKGSVASQQEPSEPDASANAMEKAAYQRALDGLTSADQDADVAIQQIHQNGC